MFEKITEHVYIRKYQHYTDRPNIGYIRGASRALLFDAGNSEANVELLKRELTEAGVPMPDLVALSHWHWDHSFGVAFWGVPVIAGRETDEQLRKMMAWKWDDASMEQRIDGGEDIVFCSEMIKREYPDRSKIKVVGADIVFDGKLTIDLGGVTCELIHAKGPHSSDSVICYIPEDRFVFLGDSNCKDLYGLPWHFDIAHEEDFVPTTDALPYDREKVDAFIALLDTLDFTHCVSGHADPKTRQKQYQSLER
ncbi:MAG: MBL fold metallo-hydrolase [Ruminococcaceae bacterium]|nr:MBL fold metallo-hydrolase [Oscillospiraceae bacterium]